jgi:hypothetical protein
VRSRTNVFAVAGILAAALAFLTSCGRESFTDLVVTRSYLEVDEKGIGTLIVEAETRPPSSGREVRLRVGESGKGSTTPPHDVTKTTDGSGKVSFAEKVGKDELASVADDLTFSLHAVLPYSSGGIAGPADHPKDVTDKVPLPEGPLVPK